MKKYILLILLACAGLLARAQSIMQQRFVLSYDGASIAAPLQLADSSYVVTGYDDSSNVHRTILLKLDKYGNNVSHYAYGSTDHENLLGLNVVQAADQGFFIIANYHLSAPPPNNIDKGVVIRVNAAGALQWTKSFTGSFAFALGMDCAEMADGGFVFCGIEHLSFFAKRTFVAKLDAAGNLAWSRSMPDNSNNAHANLVKKANGNILVAWDSKANLDISLLELDAAGNTVWGHAYKCGGIYHWAQCINTDAQGNILLAGIGVHTSNLAPYTGQPTITKLDAAGNLLWRKKYNASWAIAEPLSIGQDHAGNYVLSIEPEGVTVSAYASYPRTIMKVNSNGNPVSLQHSMDNYMVFRDKMKITSDRGLIGTGAYDVGTITHSSLVKSGSSNEVYCYTDNVASITDSAYTVTAAAASPLIAYTLAMGSQPVYAVTPVYSVTKLCSDSALINMEELAAHEHDAGTFRFSIVPNPSGSSPHISLMLAAPGPVKVEVTNILGETAGAFTFVLAAGAHELDLPIPAVPGAYFVIVSAGGWFSAKQFILVE